MNCDQTRPELSALLDHELPAAQAAAVEAHVAGCPACGAELESLRRASRMVRDLPLRPLPAGFLTRLSERRVTGRAPDAAPAETPRWRPLVMVTAFAAVAVVVLGPWRERLARAPGMPISGAASQLQGEDLPPMKGVAPERSEGESFRTARRAEPPSPVGQPLESVGQSLQSAAPAPAPNAPAAPAAPPPVAENAPAAADALEKAKAPSAASARGFAKAAPKLEMPAVRGLASGGAGLASGAPAGSPQAYSNEQLHELLEKQSQADGIQAAPQEEEKEDTSFIGKRLGQPGNREQAEASIRQLSALRKQVDEAAGKQAPIAIEGTVAPVLKLADTGTGGRALDDAKPLADGFWSGDYAAGNEGTRTVEDQTSWTALWRTLSTADPPRVDFKQSVVVAVFLGPRSTGGYAVEFAETKRLAHALVVRWRERSPEPGQSPPEGATSPYALKVLPRVDVPVRFEKTR